MKKFLLTIVAIFMVTTVAFYYNQSSTSTVDVEEDEFLTAITIDINPSVELFTNDSGKVVKYDALNDDGIILLDGLNLKNMTVEAATNALFTKATTLGYIDMDSEDNAILVTVLDEDEDDGDKIADQVEDAIEGAALENGVEVTVIKQGITDELKEQANDYGISNGKMMYITKVAEKYGFEVEELAPLSISEIQVKIKTLTGNPSVEKSNSNSTEKADMSDPEVRDAAKAEKEAALAEKKAAKASTASDDDEEELTEGAASE